MDLSQKMPSVVEEIVDNPPQKPSTSYRNIFLATFAVQLYTVGMGMVTTYPSPACADMQKPGSRLRDITSEEISWIASLPMLSGLFGNAFSGYVCHRFGRKKTLMYLSVSYTFGWLCIAYAPNVAFVIVGRILSGFSTGMCTVAVPTYVVEISTVETRGFLTSTFQVGFCLGALAMNGFGIILRWSWLAILGATVVATGASLLFFMPESPPWLIRASKYGEAIKGIRFLKGKNHDAVKEFKETVEHLSDEPKNNFSFRELMDPGLYKPMLIAVILMFNQAFCGYPAIMTYAVEVFQMTKSSVDPNVAATLVVLIQTIATIISSLLMDRAGRKVLYVTAGGCVGVSLIIFGIYNYIFVKNNAADLSNWTWVPVFSLIAYLSTHSIGFGSVAFVVIPELVPIRSRSSVMAVATVIGSFFGFIVIKLFDVMRSVMGLYGTFWMYAIFSFAGALFYLIFVPETKGRTMHDIHKSFSKSKLKNISEK